MEEKPQDPRPEQSIRFCTARDGAKIAYAVTGKGPPLVRAAHYLSHLEFDYESPIWRHWIRELSRYNTYVRYDERGCGLSDPSPRNFSFDAWVSDLETVVDSVELDKFDLLGVSQGGAVAIAYAVRHPERVNRLILYGAYARGWGRRLGTEESSETIETRQTMQKLIGLGWGRDNPAFRQLFTSLFVPDGGPEEQKWFNELQRVSCSPENALKFDRVFADIDVTELLSKITVPTLILHARNDGVVPLEEGRLLASRIPGARFVSFDGTNHILLEQEKGWERFLEEVRHFIGVQSAPTGPTLLPESLKLPLWESILPSGLRYGANYLVEFEPQSLWFEASLTLCAQALRMGVRTDYHTFTHTSADVRRQLTLMGLDPEKLEADDTFRIIDSYAVQTGLGFPQHTDRRTGTFNVDESSVKMEDWDRSSVDVIRAEALAADRRRLHIDDNTSVLVQFNDEKSVVEHFRTRTVPFARHLELAAIHSVAAGIFSESFYRQFEAFADAIFDFKSQEAGGKMSHSMRLRVARGKQHDSAWRKLELRPSGEVAVERAPAYLQSLDIPFFGELVPGGIEYGSVLLVEFEPQSCWYDAAYTIAAQALKKGLKTDLHIFQHDLREVREAVRKLGVDIGALQEQDTLRFIDSFSVQVGVKPAEKVRGADSFKTESVRIEDWAKAVGTQISEATPESERNRIHIDDNTAVLVRYNREEGIFDYWRTRIIPLYKESGGILINAVVLGIASDSFYKQHESLVDGIIDCRSREEDGVVEHYIRVRMLRGKSVDSRWQHVRIADGEVVLEPDRRRERSLPGPAFEAERRLAAIMFTDTVGFTGLGQRNESLMVELTEEQRALVRPLFDRHRGREVKTTGDGFLVEFSSALEAVRCALRIQDTLSERNLARSEERRMLVRIGIHLGDVIHAGSDVTGDAVNVASRIEPLAPPGGICLTGQVYTSVVNKVECKFEPLGTPRLKNVATPIEVFRVSGYGQGASPPAQASTLLPSNRIAVLPFTNISREKEDEYFAEGMTEEMISAISKIGGLRVIARTSVMRYKGKDKPISEIGNELKVGTVLEGSVRKQGNKVRINVQLVDATNEEERWSEEYDRDLQDIFTIQEDIGQKVADALKVRVLHGELKAVGREGTQKPDAYVQYLRGRQHWNRRTKGDLEEAVKRFEDALSIDPIYAKAYSGIADAYAMLASYATEYLPPLVAYPKAREAVRKALELDSKLAEAHTSLGVVKFHYDWDWNGAEEEFVKAIELGPSYAPAHQFYSDHLKAMGRLDEALREVRKAQELDPLSLPINSAVGHVLYLSRQYDAAIEQYRRVVELDPSFMQTHIWFGRPLLEKGLYEEALVELETGVRLSGESNVALGMLGHGLASAGRKDEALKILEKLKERSKTQYVSSYWIAAVYNGMKDRENTVAWLRKAFAERSSWLVWCNVEPRFDWLRDDPGFTALMRAMKFP